MNANKWSSNEAKPAEVTDRLKNFVAAAFIVLIIGAVLFLGFIFLMAM